MAKAQQAWKVHYNYHHTTVEYQVGDAVLLSTRHLPTVGSWKLMPHFIGPFCIMQKIGEQAYEVWLPPTMDTNPPGLPCFSTKTVSHGYWRVTTTCLD